jgi:EAL domain-containing protein (putative c-di-GMP-specific phosphodiesterase class I)
VRAAQALAKTVSRLGAQAWQDIGLAPIRIGINISAVELRAGDFVEFMNQLIAATGLEPRFLELELTMWSTIGE